MNKYAEVGFRLPRVLKRYESHGYRVVGYDISSFNVDVGKFLGYDCEIWDLNDRSQDSSERRHDIVSCYHVLGHTFDPVSALRGIVTRLTSGGIVHIEVPIEPGIPRLRYGHLIGFEKGDLRRMVEEVGLTVLNFEDAPHPGGPAIERVVAERRLVDSGF
jgi:SAM-dependent methyltransferase